MKFQGLVLTVAIFFSGVGYTYIVPGSMGRDAESSQGQCIQMKDVLSQKKIDVALARMILQRNQVKTTSNVTHLELIALARGINKIEELHGKPFPGIAGVNFIYTSSDSVWNQSSGPIKVNRNWSTDTGMHSRNVGMLMHELGHYVGNNKNPENPAAYAKYFRAVPTPCHFSWYAQQSRNEEFADVFASFIVNPKNLLKMGSPGCKKAYEFFKTKVFPKEPLAKCPGSAN